MIRMEDICIVEGNWGQMKKFNEIISYTWATRGASGGEYQEINIFKSLNLSLSLSNSPFQYLPDPRPSVTSSAYPFHTTNTFWLKVFSPSMIWGCFGYCIYVYGLTGQHSFDGQTDDMWEDMRVSEDIGQNTLYNGIQMDRIYLLWIR